MGFSCGIIGLPNVGKSTIFNALTSAKAAASNFPFCTIEPNTGAVPVPDPRLDVIAKLSKAEKVVPTQINFVDVAGLIRGASRGEGLGNQFLGHIRNVDAVAHIVRCFNDDDVVHLEGTIDPVRDIEIVETELLLADLESITKKLPHMDKVAKSGDKDARARLPVYAGLEAHLSAGLPARSYRNEHVPEEIINEIRSNLLTAKPALYVANVSEADAAEGPPPALAEYARSHGAETVVLSGKIEAEISELPREERAEYLSSLGLEHSGLDRLIVAGYHLLGLITFFTTESRICQAWTAPDGSTAPKCAGKIHSDFERGFIRAEVIHFNDYVACGSEAKARELGKIRLEGRDYLVKEGDIMHFRFNV